MRFLIIFFSVLLFASVGNFTEIKGNVKVLRNNKYLKANINIPLEINDSVITYDNSKAKVVFKDNTIITLGQNSVFKIKDYFFSKKPKARFAFLKGTFLSVTGKIGKIAPNRFKLETKNASIGIRGTIVFGHLYLSGDIIGCSEGLISVSKNGKMILVKPGEMVGVFKNIITTPFKVSSSYLNYLFNELSLNSFEIKSFFGLLSKNLFVGSNSKNNSELNNLKKVNENRKPKIMLRWKDYIIEKVHKVENKQFETIHFDNKIFFEKLKKK
jgi:hypothetical protein